MFLLVPAYPGCPGQTAVKWLSLYLMHAMRPKPRTQQYLEVAERDPWKYDIALLGPVLPSGQLTGHFEPERVVLGRQHDAQQEQLADGVADVEEFRDEKQHHQIVAESEYHHKPLCSASYVG